MTLTWAALLSSNMFPPKCLHEKASSKICPQKCPLQNIPSKTPPPKFVLQNVSSKMFPINMLIYCLPAAPRLTWLLLLWFTNGQQFTIFDFHHPITVLHQLLLWFTREKQLTMFEFELQRNNLLTPKIHKRAVVIIVQSNVMVLCNIYGPKAIIYMGATSWSLKSETEVSPSF